MITDNNFLFLNLILLGFWLTGALLIAYGVKRLMYSKIELSKKDTKRKKLIKRKITVTYIVLIWFLIWELFVSVTWINEIIKYLR